MKNQLLIAGGFVLILAVCILVIRYEAEQTRNAMRETAASVVKEGLSQSLGSATDPKAVGDAVDTVQSILNDSARQTVEQAPGMVKPAAEAAREVVQELQGIVSAPRPSTATRPQPQATPQPTGTRRMPAIASILDEIELTIEDIIEARAEERSGRSAGNTDAKPSTSDDGKSKDDAKRERPRLVIRPEDPIGSVLDFTRRTVEKSDDYGQSLMRLTPPEEQAWGKKLHEEVIVESKVIRDIDINRRIARLAEPIVARRKRSEIKYTFTILQSPPDDLNAFSLPGGYVYVHTALIDFVQNDQELQFVLAHEIGHVDLEHCNRKLTYAARASDLTAPAVGGFVAILHNIMSRPYAKEEEFEADAYSLKACVAVGQSRDEALAFPRRFGQYMSKQERSGSRSPRTGGILADVFEQAEDHFSTHPPMDERIARLEAVQLD